MWSSSIHLYPHSSISCSIVDLEIGERWQYYNWLVSSPFWWVVGGGIRICGCLYIHIERRRLSQTRLMNNYCTPRPWWSKRMQTDTYARIILEASLWHWQVAQITWGGEGTKTALAISFEGHERYGDTFGQYAGGMFTILTRDSRNIASLLSGQSSMFDSGNLRRICFGCLLGEGTFTGNGEDRKRSRKLLASGSRCPSFRFSYHRVSLSKHVADDFFLRKKSVAHRCSIYPL